MSKEKKFHVQAGIFVADSGGKRWCTALSEASAHVIANALQAYYDAIDGAPAGAERPTEPKPTQSAADPVDAPDHYRQGEIECIDAIKAMLGNEGFACYVRGTLMRYVWRLPHKGNPAEDAGKARNYAERLERLLAE